MSAGGSVRVLLVSGDEDLRDQLGAILEQRVPDHRLHWVSQPELAVDRANELIPDLILVDCESGGRDSVPFIRRLLAAVSGSAVVALVPEEGTREAARAVLAGARGFATKPLIADDLVATLRHVLAREREPLTEEEPRMSQGQVIVLCAPKGGTGRTTLAINLATWLRQLSGEPVVLIDADYAAPALDVALNINAEWDIADLLPRLSQLDEALVSAVLHEHASGVKVLLAPPPADQSDPISVPKVQRILVVLRRMFPWVIVDLGLPLDETAFGFLDSADCILVSALPEMVGLRNTRLLLNQLRDRGYADERIWLVLNRAGMRGGVSQHDIEQRLQVRFQHSVPEDQPLATHSINRGVPLTMSHPRSAVARAVRGLSEKLINDLRPGMEMEDSPSEGPGAAIRAAIRMAWTRIRERLLGSLSVATGVVVMGLLGPLLGAWQPGATVGLAFFLVGMILYRRGR